MECAVKCDHRIISCGYLYGNIVAVMSCELRISSTVPYKSILEGAQRPKDLVAGSNLPPPHRMLRHSQAHSSSMDLCTSPS
ncbi:MAG: hypothetical protein FWF18_01935 [Dehalococcoidia bacterium]|nr:hypothetical protein [Dehalococcoidia bacterium]